MQRAGAPVDEFLNEGRQGGASGPFSTEALDLLSCWDLSRQEEPEETFRQGLRATGRFRKRLLDVGNGVTTESDTLFGIEDGSYSAR